MTKHRFVFLDGLRGIAALAVVCLHAGIGFNVPALGHHGYLAVDFFFCLSGFVIAHAYEERIKSGMHFGAFALTRLIRLYPMIFAAAIAAPLIYFAGAPAPNFQQLILLTCSGFLLLPLGFCFHLAAFPLNGPLWSLFFEFFANALYFFEARAASIPLKKYAVYLLCLGIVLGALIFQVGTADAIGFSSPPSFAAGFGRVLYAFFAGVLMHRFSLARHLPRLPPLALAAVLIAVLYLPATPATPVYDGAAILLLFPLIVAFGAKQTQAGLLTNFWSFCGRLSYPLYVIHEPVLRALHRICAAEVPRHAALTAAFSITAAVLVSALLMAAYDEPLRAWLSRRNRASASASFKPRKQPLF